MTSVTADIVRPPAQPKTFRVILVGGGVQSALKRRALGADCVGAIDGGDDENTVFRLVSAPLEAYDAAILCEPSLANAEMAAYLARNGKHAHVTGPLMVERDADIQRIETLARANAVLVIASYEHRFEPHFEAIYDLLESRRLGRLYRCRLFFGIGAPLPGLSSVDDVLNDLGAPLLDTARYWFGDLADDLEFANAGLRSRNASAHLMLQSRRSRPRLELEMSLVPWRAQFTADLLAETGSAHVASLRKWDRTSVTTRLLTRAAGETATEIRRVVDEGALWERDYACFRALALEGAAARLENDVWLNRALRRLGDTATRRAAAAQRAA